MKKHIVFLTVLFFLFALCFTVNGQNDNSNVIRDISPFMLNNVSTAVLNGFGETNEGWESEDAASEVTLAETISAFPNKPLSQDGCLIVRTEEAQRGKRYYITKNFADHLDLSSYGAIILSVNCTEIKNCSYKIVVELYSDEDVFNVTDEIYADSWNGVFIDISDWENRKALKKIRISVNYEGGEEETSFFEYFVDSVVLSNNSRAFERVAFSADKYNIVGGSLSINGGVMKIDGVADELRLDSVGFAYKDIGGADGLKVDFKVDGYCQGVRMYQRSGSDYSETGYVSVNVSGGEFSVCFPVGNNVDGIRLVFEGVKLGNVNIYGIYPSSFYVYSGDKNGKIDTCALNSNTEEIIVKGSINKDAFADDVGDIYLFANELSEDVTPESLANASQIGRSSVSSGDFIFRVKYSGNGDERMYLYKKFTVAVKTQTGFEIVGASKCISNPESFAKDVDDVSRQGSGKGIYGESISFMQEVGVSDTVVWVDIGKFFTQSSVAGNKFECGGNLYYYDADYFGEVDTLIKNFAEKNIDVTVIFVVSDTGNEALNRVLIHKDADISARYCAYNTTDRQGIMYLRAICEFFASRYCNGKGVTRFVFGDCVTAAERNYNMGQKNLSSFVAEYAVGLRVVYNAVRSYDPFVEVYTYIDDSWNRGLPFDLYARYDNRAFLDSLNTCVSEIGDIDWGLAHNPYPYGVYDYYSYKNSSDNTFFADSAGFGNLGVVINYLKDSDLLYNNSERDYIIIEDTFFNDDDPIKLTADYVFNCYKALNTVVSAYITDRNSNYNDAMKYVDTSLSLTASSFVSDVLGVATWESVIEGFSGDNIEKVKINMGKISLVEPKTKGAHLLSDFSGGLDGWAEYGFTEKITASATLGGRSGLLSLFLGNVPSGETRGVIKKYNGSFDMSYAPIIHFGISVASLPTNVDFANITVIATSDNEVYELSGTVKEAVWTEIYCDLSEFSGIKRVDSLKILFHADENYYDSPQILISPIELLSLEHTSEELGVLFNPSISEELFVIRIKKYLYPVLVASLTVSLGVFIWRRTAKKSKK